MFLLSTAPQIQPSRCKFDLVYRASLPHLHFFFQFHLKPQRPRGRACTCLPALQLLHCIRDEPGSAGRWKRVSTTPHSQPQKCYINLTRRSPPPRSSIYCSGRPDAGDTVTAEVCVRAGEKPVNCDFFRSTGVISLCAHRAHCVSALLSKV